MLNLLPVKLILSAFALYCGGIVVWLQVSGAFTGATQHDLWLLATRLLGAPAAITLIVYLLWRFFKPFQLSTFPRLGGRWTGKIMYLDADRQVEKPATLVIKHSLGAISLALESEESVSETLAVTPTKDETGTKFRLYYVFKNTRKPQYCIPGRETSYRGVAILLVSELLDRVDGHYFTDQKTQGSIEFKLVKSSWL